MLKLLGALFLGGGVAAIGVQAAAKLGRRVRDIRAMLTALEPLEREISFRLTSMPELLATVAVQAPAPANSFFARCLNSLDRLGTCRFAELWNEALDQTPMELGDRERQALRLLGEVLGQYDGEGQRETLGLVRAALTQGLNQAEENRMRQGRVYSTLGVAAGALLVLLLL